MDVDAFLLSLHEGSCESSGSFKIPKSQSKPDLVERAAVQLCKAGRYEEALAVCESYERRGDDIQPLDCAIAERRTWLLAALGRHDETLWAQAETNWRELYERASHQAVTLETEIDMLDLEIDADFISAIKRLKRPVAVHLYRHFVVLTTHPKAFNGSLSIDLMGERRDLLLGHYISGRHLLWARNCRLDSPYRTHYCCWVLLDAGLHPQPPTSENSIFLAQIGLQKVIGLACQLIDAVLDQVQSDDSWKAQFLLLRASGLRLQGREDEVPAILKEIFNLDWRDAVFDRVQFVDELRRCGLQEELQQVLAEDPVFTQAP